MRKHPVIIQGGMGAGVSSWRLAHAVSERGELGVVSGTALETILARRLEDGDNGGHMRRALDHFPFKAMAERVWTNYYVAGGKTELASYKKIELYTKDPSRQVQELSMVSNFVEVWLAHEGHSKPVGINYLEKVQMPHLPSIYGAMLAGVDYVLMGAGIPLKIPGVLDKFANHEAATYPLYVGGQQGEEVLLSLDPREFMECEVGPLKRPIFLAIVASNTLATTLVKKANGRVDGFIIEGPTAGGHNAPPRGKLQLTDAGEALYGERDIVDLAKIAELGLPFWLAGGYGSAAKVQEALDAGADGVQVGTAFAFCEESGLREDYKRQLLREAAAGMVTVFSDPVASPTGFPFKTALLDNTNTVKELYEARPRICDVGHLRESLRNEAGEVVYRCAAEPQSIYISKGGKVEDTEGKKCLCNGLLANVGLQQIRAGKNEERGLVTAGDDLKEIATFLAPGAVTYTAAEVLAKLRGEGVDFSAIAEIQMPESVAQ